MAYELSFSPEFFTGDGMVTDECPEWPREKPQSVLEAADAMTPEERLEVAREVFGYDNETATFWVESETFAWDILEKVQETNTCGDLRTPVDVWIDPEGYYTLNVY